MKKIFLDLGKQPLANAFRLKGKNEFYNLENFNSRDIETLQKKYLEINESTNENDLSSKLFFIDLNWIKSNSNSYIIKNIKNLLNSIK